MGLCLTYRVGSNVLILANSCTLTRKKKGGPYKSIQGTFVKRIHPNLHILR